MDSHGSEVHQDQIARPSWRKKAIAECSVLCAFIVISSIFSHGIARAQTAPAPVTTEIGDVLAELRETTGGLVVQSGRRRLALENSAGLEGSSTLQGVESPAGPALVARRGEHFWVVLLGRRPTLLLEGNSAFVGDLGERTRQIARVTENNILVGVEVERRTLCGQESLPLLSARAIHPSGELRSVTIPSFVQNASPAELSASAGMPENLAPARPLRLLHPHSVTSRAGSPVTSATPDHALVDDNSETDWVEAHPGDGRYEAVTFRVSSLPLEGLFFRRSNREGVDAPGGLWILHEGGIFHTSLPAGEEAHIRFDAAIETSCLSIVFDRPLEENASAHVGLAEVRALSGLDEGGVDVLIPKLAGGGEEAERAVTLLTALGPEVVSPIRNAWPRMPTQEKRYAARVFANFVDGEGASALALAVHEPDEELRSFALETLSTRGPVEELERLLATAEHDETIAPALVQRFPERAFGMLFGALKQDPARASLRRPAAVALAGASEAPTWTDEDTSALASLALEARPAQLSTILNTIATAAPEDFPTRYRAAVASQRASELGERVQAWLETEARAEEWMMRAAAISALPPAHPAVVAALRDEVPRVRSAAATRMDEESASGQLRTLATMARRDAWPNVRAAATVALTHVTEARRILWAATDDPSSRVRESAVRSLLAAESFEAESVTRVRARLLDDRELPAVIRAGLAYERTQCTEASFEALEAVFARSQRQNVWEPDLALSAEAMQLARAIAPEDERTRTMLQTARSENAPRALQDAAEQEVEGCR